MSWALYVSIIVVGRLRPTRIARTSSARDGARRSRASVAREQDGQRDQQDLPGAEADPRRLGDPDEVQQEQADDESRAAPIASGRTFRDAAAASSPASAGTSTGPSESSSVDDRAVAREAREADIAAPAPAPSITRLAAPQPTASTTGTAATTCREQVPRSRPACAAHRA